MSYEKSKAEPETASILDMDIEAKLKLTGLSHLIPKVRELERHIDPIAMDMLDKLLLYKAKQNRIKYDQWISKMAKHYAALQLTPSATEEEIKRRYRRLARLHHPDLGGDKEAMQRIAEAYDAILTELKKQRF